MCRTIAVFLALAFAGAIARAQSANNNFASPTVVNGNSYTSPNIAMGANTKEPGEPNHAGQAGGRSAWWLWTPSVSGVFKVTTAGTTIDTVLAVYPNTAGMPAASNVIAQCNNTTTADLTSLVRVRAVAGTSYRIAVDTVNAVGGNVLLGISSEPSPPAHDTLAAAQVLAGPFPLNATNQSNARATAEPGEPIPHSDRGPQSSVWYKFTPAANAVVTVAATATTSPATSLLPQWAVYTADIFSTLTRVGAMFPFAVQAGTPYYIQVTGQGFDAQTKEGTFNLQVAVAPSITSIVLAPEYYWQWLHPLTVSSPTVHPAWASTWQIVDDPTSYNGHVFQPYAQAPLGFGGIDFLPGTTTHIGTASGLANNAAYFRTIFEVTSPVSALWAEVLADDGAWIYFDGAAPFPVNITQPDAHFSSPPPLNLSQARTLHTSTRLADGRVLIVGGLSNTTSLATAEIYDPAQFSMASTGSLTGARHAHTASLLANGKVLVAGGYDGVSHLNTALLYDPATGVWTPTGAMVTGRRYHTAVVLNDGRVLVSGGIGAAGVLQLAETYNPATGVWTAAANTPQVRERHTAVLLADGKVLSSCGYSGTAVRTSSERFDPVANTWAATASFTGRRSHTATLLNNGKVLLAGGEDGAGAGLNVCQLYDPVANTVAAAGNLLTARSNHTASLLPNGKVLVAGGRNSTNHFASCEVYDPANNTWTATGALPAATSSHSAATLADGRVLVTGGNNATAPLNTAVVYSHTTGTWVAPSAPSCVAANATDTETKTKRILLNPNGFPVAPGYHSLAVSLHQNANTSSDIGFDLMLFEAPVSYGRPFPGQQLYARFQEPALGASSHPGTGAELGWSRTGTAVVADEAAIATAYRINPTTNKFIRLLNTSATPFVTEAVDVSSLSTFKSAVKLRAFTDNGNGFEVEDRIQVYLETSPDGINFFPAGDLQPLLTGGGTAPDSILFEIGPPESYKPQTKNPEWIERRIRVEGNTAKAARLVFNGISDSVNDHILVDDLGFEKVGCRIFALMRERTYNNQGDDILANDTWSFNPMIVSEDAGTGWQASLTNFTGPTPVFQSGTYTNEVPVGPFLVNGGARTITFRDSATPSCTVTVSGSPPTCLLNTPIVTNKVRDPGASPALEDDVFTFDLLVTADNASTGWNISAADLPGGATGLYGQATRVTMPTTPGSRTLTVRDRANSACTVAIAVSVPPSSIYVMGDLKVDETLFPVTSDPGTIPPAAWQNLREKFLRHNSGGLATLSSDWVDLSLLSGPVAFSATLVAHEDSTSSNFEAVDKFKLELVLDDGGFLTTVNLVQGSPRDLNADGFWNGSGGTYAAEQDEFNLASLAIAGLVSNQFSLAYSIPDTYARARVVLTGFTDSTSEKLDVRNLRFSTTLPQDADGDGMWDGWETHFLGSTNAMPGVDHDLDGMSNLDEFVAGTEPNNNLEYLEVVSTALSGTDLTFSWSSQPGKYYQLMEGDSPFPDGAWLEVGDRIPSQGDAQTTVTYPAATSLFSNRYYRVKVVP